MREKFDKVPQNILVTKFLQRVPEQSPSRKKVLYCKHDLTVIDLSVHRSNNRKRVLILQYLTLFSLTLFQLSEFPVIRFSNFLNFL